MQSTVTLEEKYQQLYERLLAEVAALHKANQRRIRVGMRALVIVTVGLLLLMFLASGNKVFTLILWILSMFALSAYLIGVEYMDYELQKKLRDITQEEEAVLGQLTALPQLNRGALLAQLLKQRGQAEAPAPAESAEDAQKEPIEAELGKDGSPAVPLPMPEEAARPVPDGPAAALPGPDTPTRSDPQRIAADLAQLAQTLQALSADLAAGDGQAPANEEVEPQ